MAIVSRCEDRCSNFSEARSASKELHFELHLLYTSRRQSVPLSSATKDELAKAAQTLGLPLMLKSRREAYVTTGEFDQIVTSITVSRVIHRALERARE